MRQAGKLGFVVGIFLLLPAAPVQGEFFQWTDSRGVIHFTDNVYSVPEVLRGSPELVIREDIELRAGISEAPAEAEPVGFDEKPPEMTSPPEPEPIETAQPIIHYYNSQSFHIVVVHPLKVRRHKERRCFLPEGCRPAFRPDFNDRRFIHPSAFNGGPQQYVHPQPFPSTRR